MTAVRPSRCASTAAPGSPAPARSSTAASATARTPSTCAQPTPPATSTSPPPRFAWTVDTAAPNTTITWQPGEPDERDGRHLLLHLQRGLLDLRVPLDGGGWGACTTPSFYGSLAEGSHTFQVRATDAAANTDATPATFNWSIDLTSPTGSMTSPANARARPAQRSCSRATRQTAAPASRRSSSSARPQVQAPGRRRPRAGTRPSSPTGTMTCA